MSTLSFCVADVGFTLNFTDIPDARHLLPSYAPFFVKSLSNDEQIMNMIVGNDCETYSSENEFVGDFDCGDSFYTISKDPNGEYKILISNLQREPACALRANADFSKCKATLFGDESMQRFGLGNAIMVAFAFSAAKYGILLMHASVTENKGFAYLFLGKSGTGKSTHSSLWLKYIANSELLNDDNPAVRSYPDGRIIVYGTPWSGKTPCYRNKSLPVGAFVRLQQHPQNEIQEEPKIKAFASILSSCSTMIWDKKSYDAILSNISNVVKQVPVYFLRCRADKEAAQLCYKTIARASATDNTFQ